MHQFAASFFPQTVGAPSRDFYCKYAAPTRKGSPVLASPLKSINCFVLIQVIQRPVTVVVINGAGLALVWGMYH